jgi:hypothetical protein
MELSPTAADARAISEAVEKELEAEQAASAAENKPEAETPKVEPEAKPEVKAEEPRVDPKEEKQEEPMPERTERKSKFVPVQKANAWRHEANESKARVAELEAKLAEVQAAASKAKESDIEAIAKEVAGDDASPEVVKRILEATKRLVKSDAQSVPSDDIKSVLALKQRLDEQAEEAGFQKELNQTLAKFPELKGHEADIRETAYAEGNEKVPLELLAYKLRDELNLNAAPPSAEGKAPKVESHQAPDFANLSDKDISAMSPEDLDAFIAWQEKKLKTSTGVRF